MKIRESPLFWPAELIGRNALPPACPPLPDGQGRLCLRVLDETLIPFQMRYITITNTAGAVRIIRQMKTRAFGQFLVVLNTFLLELDKGVRSGSKPDPLRLVNKIKETARALNNSRPTFPFSEVTGMVVGWAEAAHKRNEAFQTPRQQRGIQGGLHSPQTKQASGYQARESSEDIRTVVRRNIHGFLAGIRARRLDRVERIAGIIKNNDSVLTHCNVSGELAMAAAICKKQKKRVRFFATETRPFFQGTRLTCWELKRMGADVTLIADNAVGAVMAGGFVNKVIVGSDRNCANGDFANKIGTYQIAVLAKEFGIPFYVLTQPSSKVKRGEDIPIEIRNEKELLCFAGKRIVPARIKGFYPGFDVIPGKYMTESVAINVN